VTQGAQQYRILFLDCGAGIGGSSTFLRYLLSHLDRKKFEPFVAFYFYNDGPDTEKMRTLGAKVIFLNKNQEPTDYVPIKFLLGTSKWKWWQKAKVVLRLGLRLTIVDIPLIRRLVSVLKKEAISLVLLNNHVGTHLAGVVAARLAGVPCICRKAGGIGEARRTQRLLAPWVNLFVAISQATARDQLENISSTRRLEIVHEGIDLASFAPSSGRPEVRTALGLPHSKKVVAHISRFQEGKGQKELLEAAALVVKKYDNVVFLIVGEEVPQKGSLMQELQTKALNLGLSEHVIFTGWRNDIQSVLSVVDVFVHCPTTCIEGLGLANLEAMAMGKPTVVSDVGGLPDAVLDGVTGFVVPPGDIEKLSAAILRLLEDDGLVLRYGKNARQRVEEEFDMGKNAKRLEMLFEEYALR